MSLKDILKIPALIGLLLFASGHVTENIVIKHFENQGIWPPSLLCSIAISFVTLMLIVIALFMAARVERRQKWSFIFMAVAILLAPLLSSSIIALLDRL